MPWIRIGFTVIMLVLAVLHSKLSLDSTSIGLAIAACAPWVLPELQKSLESVKVDGLFEMKFRKLEEQVAAQQVAIDNGVGGKAEKPAAMSTAAGTTHKGPASFSTTAAEDLPQVDPADPNKGQFGRSPSVNGMHLSAEVKPFPGSDRLFKVHVSVAPVDSEARVKFYLHPTFRRPVLDAEPSRRIAAIDLVAWGAFTVGATVSKGGAETRLELDLATEVPGAPAEFRSR
jgi:hypothetical protein